MEKNSVRIAVAFALLLDTVSAAFDPKTGEMVSAKVTPSGSNR
jgi:hypothetical protein